MNEHDPQLEAALTATFARRDGEVGQVAGDVADVYRRAARRRAKRRTLTAVGSVAIVAAGIGGLLAVGQIDRDTARSAGGPVTTLLGDTGSWYVCSEDLPQPDGSTLYGWCELESGYANPAWRCSGEVPDPAMDGDDRPRFQSCTAVAEAYPTVEPMCVAPTYPPTTAMTEPTLPPYPGTTPPLPPCDAECIPMFTPATTAVAVGPSDVPSPPTIEDTVAPPECAITSGFPVTAPTTVPGTLPPFLSVTGSSAPESSVPLATTTTVLLPNDTASANTGPECTDCPGVSPVEQTAVVKAGDSLASIASTYGVAIEHLVAYNQWPDGTGHVLVVDDIVKIPPNALLADDR